MRELRRVDGADAPAVLAALRNALAGGPALLPFDGTAPDDVPGKVPQPVALVVQTSGSTGSPKRVALSTDALLASAAGSDAALGGPGQWLLCLPAHYIAGVNVLVRSIAADIEPVLMEPHGFTAEGFVAACARLEHPVRYVSLVPAQLTRLLASDAAVSELQRFRAVLVGGQALPAATAEATSSAGVRVVRTYGSSETSGGCVYDGVPFGTVGVRIVYGRVSLAGPMLAEGYLDDPARTEAAFETADGLHWYRTDDAGELVDGVLSVTGRLDDVIVSGGVKVSLAAVEAAVRSLPGQADAVAVRVPDDAWGERVAVVTESPLDESTVRAVVEHLGPAARPARLVVVDALPQLASGKPDRRALAALAASAP